VRIDRCRRSFQSLVKWAVTAVAIVGLVFAAPAGAGARVLGLTPIGEAPPYRATGELQAASDGRRLLFVRSDRLTLRVLDTRSHTNRRVDIAGIGVSDNDDCRPAAATRTILLVSCDRAGAVLLRLPTFARIAVPPPTPPLGYLVPVFPAQWSGMGKHWLVGVSNCMKPEPVCAPFYFNYRTGAYRLGGVVWDDIRMPFSGARVLDDPELGPVRGCERTLFQECTEEGGFALRWRGDGRVHRLELLRDGRAVATLSRTFGVFAARLQGGRAAWIEGNRVRLYDIAHGGQATYGVPALGRLFRATEVLQTANRVLVAVESTDPMATSYFYVGTIPRALR
jgi:hypothetical protein